LDTVRQRRWLQAPIDYAKFCSLWHVTAVRVYDSAGNVIKHASQVAEYSKRLT